MSHNASVSSPALDNVKMSDPHKQTEPQQSDKARRSGNKTVTLSFRHQVAYLVIFAAK